MTLTKGIGQLTIDLQELVRIHMENGARLLMVPDKAAADALDRDRQLYQNVLDLISGKKTLDQLKDEANTAITAHVPNLPA